MGGIVMTQKDKELLFRDLSARLPYHIRVKVWLKDGTTEEGALDLEHNYGDVLRDAFYYNKIVKIKPYLLPLSSITEGQKNHISQLLLDAKIEYPSYEEDYDNLLANSVKQANTLINYCLASHLDINGLIEKGLAIDATGLNIY